MVFPVEKTPKEFIGVGKVYTPVEVFWMVLKIVINVSGKGNVS